MYVCIYVYVYIYIIHIHYNIFLEGKGQLWILKNC